LEVVEVDESLQELDRKLTRFRAWKSPGLFDNIKAMSEIGRGMGALWRKEIQRVGGHYVLLLSFKHSRHSSWIALR